MLIESGSTLKITGVDNGNNDRTLTLTTANSTGLIAVVNGADCWN